MVLMNNAPNGVGEESVQGGMFDKACGNCGQFTVYVVHRSRTIAVGLPVLVQAGKLETPTKRQAINMLLRCLYCGLGVLVEPDEDKKWAIVRSAEAWGTLELAE